MKSLTALVVLSMCFSFSANAESYRISCIGLNGVGQGTIFRTEFRSSGSISNLVGLNRASGPRDGKRLDETTQVGFGNKFDGSYYVYSLKRDEKTGELVIDARTNRDIQDVSLHIGISDFRSTIELHAKMKVWQSVDRNDIQPPLGSFWLNCTGTPFLKD